DIAAARQSHHWQQSGECKAPSWAGEKNFCAGIERLNGELAMAEEAGRLRDQDEKHAAKLSGFDLAAVMRSADPQSEALARFTGFAAPSVRDALAVLVAVLIELGSGLGLWVAAGGANHGGRKEESHATAVRQEPPPLPVAPPIEAAPGQPAPPLPGARKRPKKARKTDRPEVN